MTNIFKIIYTFKFFKLYVFFKLDSIILKINKN